MQKVKRATPYDNDIIFIWSVWLGLYLLVSAIATVPALTTLSGGEMNISDLFNTTVQQAIAWLVTFGISAGIAYALGWFPQLDTKIANAIKLVASATLVAFVTALASLIPDAWQAMKLIDAAIALVAAVLAAIGGSKFGGVKSLEHRIDAERYINSLKALGKIVVVVLAVGVLATMFAATSAVAAGPDYQYALVQCSGLSLAELQVANQKFDSWYGWQHQLTTPAQWLGTYEARVNEFAATLGCPKILDSGALTFAAKLYVPTYRFYLTDYPTPY